MKKFKYIILAGIMAVSLTACTFDMPPEDNSQPLIDIVQRSELLDMVNIDYVLDDDTKQMLADNDVSVTMADFELTANYMAQFVLTFNTANGSYSYKFNTILDYTANPDGSFDDVRLYWGSVQYADGGLLITSLYDYAFLPLDEKVENFTPHYLNFIKDKGGYIIYSTADFDRYAFFYRTPTQEGIVVFDKNGKMLGHNTNAQPALGTIGMFGTQTEALITDIPFSYENQFSGQFISENLFMINVNDSYGKTHRLYTVLNNGLSEDVHGYVEPLVIGDTEYSVYQIYLRDKSYYGGLALRKENGQFTGVVLFDTKGYSYFKQSPGTLSFVDGKLIFHTSITGLRFTIDFENNTCEKDYQVTEEMLGEKIATSKDKKFSLYEYNKHSYNSHWVSYLALKNEKTEEIFFVDNYRGTGNSEYILEAGFFSNGDIYLMTAYDFKIFTTDTVENGPIFNIGEKFPLGYQKENELRYNNLHAVRRDPENGSFIVVFDHLNQNRFYDGPKNKNDQSLFDDKYEVSLLDSEGNLIKTYMTDMPVPAGVYPLDIYLSGDVLTMQNVDRETSEILQKSTLNIKTGKFTQVKKWGNQ